MKFLYFSLTVWADMVRITYVLHSGSSHLSQERFSFPTISLT